jgi:alpha-glucosidase
VLWTAPNGTNQAEGMLYLDDGDSIEQAATSNIKFTYDNGKFEMSGTFGYDAGVSIKNITVLGAKTQQTVQGPVSLKGPYKHTFSGAGPEFQGVSASE